MAERATQSLRRPEGHGLVVAHRGAWDPAPQNSLAAFEQAITDGADAIELDVRRTADDRFVVVHDPRAGARPIAKLDHAAVLHRLAPGQAPELEEVLSAVAGRIAVDVELKENGYVGEAIEIVRRHLHPEQYVVTSFLDEVLPQVREAAPETRIGLLLASRRPARRLQRRVAETGIDFLAPHISLARTGLLAWAADHHLPAWVWTVNDVRSLRALLVDPRVEAVITDHAALAVAQATDDDLHAVA